MRVVLEEQVRGWRHALGARGPPGGMSCLLDLDLWCNLPREGCGARGAAPLPGDMVRLLSGDLARRAGEAGASRVDVAFFGGEPLLEPASLLRLSEGIQRACARDRIAYAGYLITNGTLLAAVDPRALARAGMRRIQVTLADGPRPHGASGCTPGGAGSWETIVAGVKRVRGVAEVVVRSTPERTHDLEDLLGALDAEGLLTGGGVAALLVARRAPYVEQARDLLHLFPLLDGGERTAARMLQ